MNTFKRFSVITLVLVCTGLFATTGFAASSDLKITKTANLASAQPGDTVTYTITATNLGPDQDTKVEVKDDFDIPNSFSGCTWTCSGSGATCKAPGPTAGDFDHKDMKMPSNSTLTYTASCTIAGAATGSVSNTASVTGSKNQDPVSGNNQSTVTTTITAPTADLSITKTDGVTSAFAGGAVTYTIVASNAGPNAVTTAHVTDTFPGTLACSWSCSASAGGTCKAGTTNGKIDDNNRTIPVGGTLTYTAQCSIAANATGNLVNIAQISSTVTDPVSTNNSATDTDTISQPSADLSITKTDGVTSVAKGGSVTYTIVASNAGPDPVGNAHVTDTFPAGLTCNWTCSGANGGVCTTASGSGSINQSNLIIPMGGTLTYTAVCAVSTTATGSLANTATISATATDPASGNNNATDTDTLTTAQAPSDADIIFDMSANPADVAISTNLVLYTPGSKGDSAIENGYGGNSINIEDFQVMFRDIYHNPNNLKLVIGNTEETAIDQQFGCGEEEDEEEAEECEGKTQNDQFAEGGHLFDLDRLRAIADWMSTNTTAIQTTLPAGTYGTISYAQLISNIVNKRTMYGVVRVKIPLQQCPGGENCGGTKNALGQTVAANTLYGLCKTKTGLCSCGAGTNDIATKEDIAAGKTICSMTLPQNVTPPNNVKIKVKGTMMWDFVDSTTGNPIPLEQLPWAPRDLYFKVIIPIVVNGDWDVNDDGAMDNMLYIQGLSANQTPGNISPTIDWTKIPTSTKDDYLYYTGEVLTQQKFGTLDKPTQYHLLMANGYPNGWEEAFSRLGITGNEWTNIPGVDPPLRLPDGVTGTITDDDVRSPKFEDIPAYLYTGGLIDMHDQVNISGLVYVPQGMELEAKNGSNASPQPTRQYVLGAIVVRDSFYLEAKAGETSTIISAEPAVYSTAQISETAAAASNSRDMVFGSSVASSSTISEDVDDDDDGTPTVPGTCYTGCSASTGESSHDPGTSRWIEVRPETSN